MLWPLALLVAALVFWLVEWPWWRQGELEKLPEPSFIPTSMGPIAVRAAGQGPTLILVHGWGASTLTWRRLIPLLAPQFRVITLDLPGFGQSARSPAAAYSVNALVATIIEIMDSVGGAQADFVGSSMGGTLALHLAHQHPQRVRRIVALAPACSARVMRLPLERLRHFASGLSWVINRWTMAIALRLVLADWRLIHRPLILACLQACEPRAGTFGALMATAQVLRDPRLPEIWASLPHEILVVRGRHDRLVPAWAVENLARTLPHGQRRDLPGAGHHPQEDLPETTAQLIRQFVESGPQLSS